MKVKVEVEKAQCKYVTYFDAYEDAQSEIVDFLRKCLQEDTCRNVSLDALMEVTDHYQREFTNLDKMPYYCKNENGVFVNDFCNRASYKISLVKE